MTTPTTVTHPGISESTSRALIEHCQLFFDGEDHSLGGLTLSFPTSTFSPEVKFIGQKDSPLLVVFSFDTILKEESLKCGLSDGGHGYELRASLRYNVFVRTPVSEVEAGKNSRELQRTWACLVAVFTNPLANLSARNIFKPKLDSVARQLVSSKDMTVINGDLVVEVRAKYGNDDLIEPEVP